MFGKMWATGSSFALRAPRAGGERTGLGGPGTALGVGINAGLWVVPELGTAVSAAWEVILGCRSYPGWGGCLP